MSSKLPNEYVACPHCKAKLDGASGIQDEDSNSIPGPGDLSICMYCGTILEYEEGFFLHIATDERLSQLNNEEPEVYNQLIYMRDAILAYIESKRAMMN